MPSLTTSGLASLMVRTGHSLFFCMSNNLNPYGRNVTYCVLHLDQDTPVSLVFSRTFGPSLNDFFLVAPEDHC
jgi:hypothetical protein